MKTITMKANNESEMKWMGKGLTSSGYVKTNDCMWAKIYRKDNMEYIIEREF